MSWRLRGRMEFWAFILTLTLGTTRTAELSATRAGRTLNPMKFLGYSFLLDAEWISGLPKADTRNTSFEHFQGP
jgi:hypothetical protein